MQSQEQYWLVKLGEEAMEFGHMALKTEQFGKDEAYGQYENIEHAISPDNQTRLQDELNDVLRIIKQLNDNHGYHLSTDLKIRPEKEAKMDYYFQKSINLGFVEPKINWLRDTLLKL